MNLLMHSQNIGAYHGTHGHLFWRLHPSIGTLQMSPLCDGLFISRRSSPSCSFYARHRYPPLLCRSSNEAVDSWMDLASFVAKSSSAARTPYDDLADSIGRDCYIDVAGWHLYLKDVKLPEGSGLTMAQGLAAQLGAQAQGQKQISGADVESMLKRVPVDLGKGKTTVSLERLMPSICVNDLKQIMEEYARRL